MRRTNTLYIFDRSPKTILKDTLCAGLACKPVIEREFQAFLTFIIDICESNEMTRHFAGRIVATVFALHADTRQLQRKNFLRALGTQMPLQINELLVHAARDTTNQQVRIYTQRSREFRYAINC